MPSTTWLYTSILKQHVAKWQRNSIKEEIGLGKAGKAIGLADADKNLKDSQDELRELNEMVKGLPASGGTLPSEKNMAEVVVHVREGMLVTQPFVSPLNLGFAGALFADAFLDATEAAVKLLGLNPIPELQSTRSQIEEECSSLEAEALRLMGVSREGGDDEPGKSKA